MSMPIVESSPSFPIESSKPLTVREELIIGIRTLLNDDEDHLLQKITDAELEALGSNADLHKLQHLIAKTRAKIAELQSINLEELSDSELELLREQQENKSRANLVELEQTTGYVGYRPPSPESIELLDMAAKRLPEQLPDISYTVKNGVVIKTVLDRNEGRHSSVANFEI